MHIHLFILPLMFKNFITMSGVYLGKYQQIETYFGRGLFNLYYFSVLQFETGQQKLKLHICVLTHKVKNVKSFCLFV